MLSEDVFVETQEKLSKFIREAREHLESLKGEVYRAVDAGYKRASVFDTMLKGLGSAVDYSIEPPDMAGRYVGATIVPVDYSAPPSSFLEKAYAIQLFDDKDQPISNRNPLYIDAGVEFLLLCESKKDSLTLDQRILLDAARITSVINTTLSNLKKFEIGFKKASVATPEQRQEENHLMGLSIWLHALQHDLEDVVTTCSASKMIQIIPNQNFFRKLLSSLGELCIKIKEFVSKIGKSEQQKLQFDFFKMKEKYQAVKEEGQDVDEPTSGPATP